MSASQVAGLRLLCRYCMGTELTFLRAAAWHRRLTSRGLPYLHRGATLPPSCLVLSAVLSASQLLPAALSRRRRVLAGSIWQHACILRLGRRSALRHLRPCGSVQPAQPGRGPQGQPGGSRPSRQRAQMNPSLGTGTAAEARTRCAGDEPSASLFSADGCAQPSAKKNAAL